MPRRLKPDVYAAWLDFYRAHPGECSACAANFGIDERTAKRAWERGWDYPWAPPMRDTIARERILVQSVGHEVNQQIKEEVRAEVRRLVDERLAGGNAEGAEERRRDLAMLKGQQATILLRQGMVATLQRTGAIQNLTQQLSVALSAESQKPDVARANLYALSRFLRDLAQDYDIAVDAGLKLYGKPTEIVQLDLGKVNGAELRDAADQMVQLLKLTAESTQDMEEAELEASTPAAAAEESAAAEAAQDQPAVEE